MKNKGLKLIQTLEQNAKSVFSIDQATQSLRLPKPSVMAILGRLRKKRQIITLTQGLYAILEPTEQKHGIRPLRVMVPVMSHVGINHYYLSLLSAADYWGAAHHKPMIVQVMTSKRHCLRRLTKIKMQLYTKKNWDSVGIVQAKANFGYFPVSCPELTALDVIEYQHACGGFNNVCLVVRDLVEKIKVRPLIRCCKNYKNLASVQRLGYLLEILGVSDKLLKPLKKWLQSQKPIAVPLLASYPRQGLTHENWQIIENIKPDFEE